MSKSIWWSFKCVDCKEVLTDIAQQFPFADRPSLVDSEDDLTRAIQLSDFLVQHAGHHLVFNKTWELEPWKIKLRS